MKYVQIIGVSQIAYSFHHHGIGIKNSIINFVFKYVGKKIT